MEYDTIQRFKMNKVIGVIGNDACWSQIKRDQVKILESDVATNLDYSSYENQNNTQLSVGQGTESKDETNDNNNSHNEIYYVGIIDITQQYNKKKQIESFFKGFVADQSQISSVDPERYSERMYVFIEKRIE